MKNKCPVVNFLILVEKKVVKRVTDPNLQINVKKATTLNKERKMYDARRMRVEGRMLLFCQRRRRFINTGRVYINRGRVYINRGAVYKNTQTIGK